MVVARIGRRLAVIAMVVLLAGVALAPAALAHPLGNFARNTFVGVAVGAGAVDVVVRLDLAELPTLLESQEGDADGDGTFEDSEIADHARRVCADVLGDVEITLDGRGLPLGTADGVSARLDEGEAGLDTLLVTCRTRVTDADVRDGGVLQVDNGVGPDWLGWHEVVVVGLDGVDVDGDGVPTTTTSAALLDYPEGSVLERRTATATLVVDGPVTASGAVPAWVTADDGDAQQVERVVDRDLEGGGFLEDVTGRFTDLVAERELTVGFVALAVVLSLLLGGTHALAPGHGKTVMAAYVVGQRGTTGHALAIAGVVAVTHTAGVLVLGLVISAGETVVPEDLYPWFGAVSGALLVAVGIDLLRRALRTGPAARADHAHGDHQPGDHQPGDHQPGDHGHDDRVHGDRVHGDRVHGDHGPGRGGGLAPDEATTQTAAAPEGGAVLTDEQVAVEPEHDHDDGWVVHDHGSGAHAHPLPGADITPRTLVAMGLAGGLVPSPSALLVLLGAIAIGRTGFGVVLVVTYGLGLATTLVGGGLLLVRFRAQAERLLARRRSERLSRLVARLPVLTAVAVLLGGLVVVARSVLA